MVKNSSFFYLSGFLSIGLFAFFLFVFIYVAYVSSTVNSYALKKEDYISISLVTPKIEMKTNDKNVKETQKKTSVEDTPKEIDVADLFSEVWTKKIVKTKPKPIDSKRLKEIRKKIKTVKKNESTSVSKKTNALDDSSKNDESDPTSTANEVNEYLAKIHALVYRSFTPPENSQGHSVKALIELSSIGKVLDFRVLTYSSNQALNDECDRLKEKLLGVLFPISPDKKTFSTIINIISDKNQ